MTAHNPGLVEALKTCAVLKLILLTQTSLFSEMMSCKYLIVY